MNGTVKEFLKIPKTVVVCVRDYKKVIHEFSAKFGLVTYYRTKTKMAREKSWKKWTNSAEAEISEFQNAPTPGFKVVDSFWSYGEPKCRVYDPRGFIIQIYTSDLINLIKEAGYDQEKDEFATPLLYAWDGDRPILTSPVSEDYIATVKLNEKRENLRQKDLVPGRVYRLRWHEEGIYLGKLEWRVKRNYTIKTQKYPTFVKGDYAFGEGNLGNIIYGIRDISKEELDRLIAIFKSTPAGNIAEAEELGVADLCDDSMKAAFINDIKGRTAGVMPLQSPGYRPSTKSYWVAVPSENRESVCIRALEILANSGRIAETSVFHLRLDKTKGYADWDFSTIPGAWDDSMLSRAILLPDDKINDYLEVRIGDSWYSHPTTLYSYGPHEDLSGSLPF